MRSQQSIVVLAIRSKRFRVRVHPALNAAHGIVSILEQSMQHDAPRTWPTRQHLTGNPISADQAISPPINIVGKNSVLYRFQLVAVRFHIRAEALAFFIRDLVFQ